jgi:hypothetical protein
MKKLADQTSARRSVMSVTLMAGLTCLLVGCSSYGGLNRETFAACVNEAGIVGDYRASSTLRNDELTFIVYTGPNVTSEQAAIANACIERTIDSPLPAQQSPALPSVAGVPQTVTTQTNGTTTTTYTYGTPPTAAVPASGPVRAPICNLQMTGGTGYTCAVR